MIDKTSRKDMDQPKNCNIVQIFIRCWMEHEAFTQMSGPAHSRKQKYNYSIKNIVDTAFIRFVQLFRTTETHKEDALSEKKKFHCPWKWKPLTVIPPSTQTVCPVMYEAAGRHRNATNAETSSGTPKRPKGVREFTAFRNFSSLRNCM